MRQSSASTTKFVSAQIPFRDGVLTLDGNQKITAGNGTYNDPVANAFSLPAIVSCPKRTVVCEAACYVANLKAANPSLHAAYAENLRLVSDELADPNASGDLEVLLSRYIVEQCPSGFRWHVSGDIFSEEYARSIMFTALLSLSVRHWIYTRSFDWAVKYLADVSNLALNFSVDAENLTQEVVDLAKGRARLCYLARAGDAVPELPHGSVIFPDYALRGDLEWFERLSKKQQAMVCPVDWLGKSAENRCGICRRCINLPR